MRIIGRHLGFSTHTCYLVCMLIQISINKDKFKYHPPIRQKRKKTEVKCENCDQVYIRETGRKSDTHTLHCKEVEMVSKEYVLDKIVDLYRSTT